MNDELRYPMKVVVRQTGLTPHSIRVWERRYGAVIPLRTPTNRRLYSAADIERLSMLRHLTYAGHSIGQIAQLPMDHLQSLLRADDEWGVVTPGNETMSTSVMPLTLHLETCLDAIRRLDAEALERAFAHVTVALGPRIVLEKVIVPLMRQIGELWHAGVLRMTHEHLASAVVRNFVWNLPGTYAVTPETPQLVVTTPVGQLHEIGALLVAATARTEGWGVIYLGPNLPAEEIAAAVQPGVKAVALSILYPPDDPHLLFELTKLRRYLSPDIRLLVGGRAAHAYEAGFTSIAAVHAKTLTDLRTQLQELRALRPGEEKS